MTFRPNTHNSPQHLPNRSIPTHFLVGLMLFAALFTACEPAEQGLDGSRSSIETVDRNELISDITYLASDQLEGRRTDTEGNERAREYILKRYNRLGLLPVDGSFEHPFEHINPRTEEQFERAVNLLGVIPGTGVDNASTKSEASEKSETSEVSGTSEATDSEASTASQSTTSTSAMPGDIPDGRYIAIMAHYDHLGIRDGEIFNGADDNASGVGGLLALARYFSEHPPKHHLLFMALDAEEQGLGGAVHYTEQPAVPLDRFDMVLNMDMISNNDKNELYAVGTYHYPFLKPIIEQSTTNASVNVLFGYDSDDWPQDWTMASDHGPFHGKGVPFVYFGVEDHAHYHQPSDIVENINPDFYVNATATIIEALKALDANVPVR